MSLCAARRDRQRLADSHAASRDAYVQAKKDLEDDIRQYAAEDVSDGLSPSAQARRWHAQLALDARASGKDRLDMRLPARDAIVDISDDTIERARRRMLPSALIVRAHDTRPHVTFIVRHGRMTLRVRIVHRDGHWAVETDPQLALSPPDISFSLPQWVRDVVWPAMEHASLATWEPHDNTA